MPVRLDAQRRYEVRLGPGDYEVRATGHAEVKTIHVGGGGEIVLDFLGEPIPEPVALNGVVVESVPGGGERPKEGVMVQVAGISNRVRTDAAGRFTTQRPVGDVAVYASGLGGVAAVKVAKGVDEVKIVLGPSVTSSGRVVDPSGRPLAGEQLRMLMLSGPGDLPGQTNIAWMSKFEAGRGSYGVQGPLPRRRVQAHPHSHPGHRGRGRPDDQDVPRDRAGADRPGGVHHPVAQPHGP